MCRCRKSRWEQRRPDARPSTDVGTRACCLRAWRQSRTSADLRGRGAAARGRELAEEIVQDAFIQIWSKAGHYSPERGSARGWIYAIVRNRALNALRDGKRWELVDSETLERMQDESQDSAVSDLFDWLEQESRLRRCLGALDEKKCRGILMAYVSGYTHGEIASRLKVPLGTAKAWVKRGLASLRECMS